MSYIQCGIVGKTGFGKSYLTNKLISQKHITRKIIVNPHSQLECGFFSNNINDFLLKIDGKKSFSINCVFPEYDDYDELFYYLWEIENYLLVIDEISIFTSSFNINDELQNIITRGRLKNISLLWNTQRPALISRTLTSMSYAMIYFKLNDIRDLAYIPSDLKNEVMNLEKYKYLCTDIEIIENFFKMKI